MQAPSSPLPRCLVIGYGSIGARHARLLAGMGLDVAVVSRRPLPLPNVFASVSEALARGPYGYAVVCTETSLHRRTVEELDAAGFTGILLVEKPLGNPGDAPVNGTFAAVFVAYQLRFDPSIQALRRALDGRRPLAVDVRAASWLPDWRPGRDYRRTESASRAAGGGVLRDLSHELDYTAWLFGPWRRLAAIGGRLGCLEVDSDESVRILAETARCPSVSIALSFIHHAREERRILVDTAEGVTLCADLVAATLTENGRVIHQGDPAASDPVYLALHRAVLGRDRERCCTLAEGMAVVDTIAAAETALREGRWVVR